MKILKGAYSRVLVIGDIHFPFHHKDSLTFLEYLKRRYEPDLVISIGDEVDGASWSYHEHDPGLPNPDQELLQAKLCMHKLFQIFPHLQIIESNHGSLVYRKQKTTGLPRGVFKDYNDIWELPRAWEWHFDLTIQLSNGQLCYFHHGKTSNVLKLSQSMGMNAVQGHFHEQMGAKYWRSPTGVFWGAQTGCLVDEYSMAMAYGKNNLKKPVLGSLMIQNGYPVSIPMIVNGDNRWIGKI